MKTKKRKTCVAPITCRVDLLAHITHKYSVDNILVKQCVLVTWNTNYTVREDADEPVCNEYMNIYIIPMESAANRQ